jgi:hypothetical protein
MDKNTQNILEWVKEKSTESRAPLSDNVEIIYDIFYTLAEYYINEYYPRRHINKDCNFYNTKSIAVCIKKIREFNKKDKWVQKIKHTDFTRTYSIILLDCILRESIHGKYIDNLDRLISIGPVTPVSTVVYSYPFAPIRKYGNDSDSLDDEFCIINNNEI